MTRDNHLIFLRPLDELKWALGKRPLLFGSGEFCRLPALFSRRCVMTFAVVVTETITCP